MSCCALELVFYGGLLVSLLLLLRYLIEKIQLPDLASRSVFISGCDTGFGHDLVLKCLAHGMPVFAGCLTNEGADELKVAARWLPGPLVTIIMDVTNEESVDNARKIVQEYVGDRGLHGIVNNAGIVGNSGVDDWLTLEDYKQVINVNTYGVIRTTHAFKDMVKRTRGRITTVASICARVPTPGTGPYSVSKYAVSGYCDVLRQEMRDFGVKVCILEPGYFKTPMVDEKRVTATMGRIWERLTDETRAEYGQTYFEAVKNLTATMMVKIASKDTNMVVDAYFHSLTAVFPRKRYHVGYDAIFWFIPFSMLPTDVQDFINMISFKILGAPKPASMQ
uniref:Uncharacterized protein n=1 Tax=Plectus sambesii TaxID=2011161 RepID=A0A914W6J0_9BILA